MKIFSLLLVLGAALLARPARAYLVGPAPELTALNASSSLVAKVTALSSQDAKDASFEIYGGFVANQTRFRVVSVLKDDTKTVVPDGAIEFRHYAPFSEREPFRAMYVPHYYRFVPGRSYLLWAKKSADGWQQFSMAPTEFQQQGALLAPDDAPVAGQIRGVIWQQTNALLRSSAAADQIAAMEILSAMSRPFVGSALDGTDDFRRVEVIAEIAPLIASDNSEVALTAIGVARLDARRAIEPLLAATRADSVAVRVAALDALAPAKTAAVENRAREAARDDDARVGAAGLRLLGTFPDEPTRTAWKLALASDDKTRVAGAIEGIRIARAAPLLPDLAALLNNANADIQQQAANAMLSFPDASAQTWWKKASAHPQWGPVFIVKLAQNSRETANYLTQLTRIVARKREPVTSGQSALYGSRRVLLNYLNEQTRADLQKPGKFTAVYDALETPGDIGQSLDLYRFYQKSGLKTRAQTLREQEELANPQVKSWFDEVEK